MANDDPSSETPAPQQAQRVAKYLRRRAPDSVQQLNEAIQRARDHLGPTSADPSPAGARLGGPETRETWLHRRTKVIRVAVRDLKNLTAYTQEEMLLFAAGQFFFSGGLWLGAEKVLEGGWRSPVVGMCAVAVIAGLVLALVGWRQIARKSAAIEDLLAEVEEEEKR